LLVDHPGVESIARADERSVAIYQNRKHLQTLSILSQASGIERAFRAFVSASPGGYYVMLSWILNGQRAGTEVLFQCNLNEPVLLDMLEVLLTGYKSWITVMLADSGNTTLSDRWASDTLNALPAAACVCRNGTCNYLL